MAICMKSSVQKGQSGDRGARVNLKSLVHFQDLLGMPAHYQLAAFSFCPVHKIQLLSSAHHNLQISTAYPKFTEVMQIQYTPTLKLTINRRNKELKIYVTFNSDYT